MSYINYQSSFSYVAHYISRSGRYVIDDYGMLVHSLDLCWANI